MKELSIILTWVLFHSVWIAFFCWLLVRVSVIFFNTSHRRRIIRILGLVLFLIGVGLAYFNETPSLPYNGYMAVFSNELVLTQPKLTPIDQAKIWITSQSTYISLIWLLGAILGTLKFASSRNFLAKYKSNALPCTDPSILEKLESIKQKLRVKKKVTLLISVLIESPMTSGVLKPIIYFPAGLISGFSEAELDTILTHELAHIKKGDYLLNIGLVVLETIFFFNPMIILMIHDLRKEMEYTCDDEVLKQHDEITYAKALVTLQEITISNQVALAAKNNNSTFKKRIERMINSKNNTNSNKMAFIAILFISILVSSAFMRSPAPFESDEVIPQQTTKKDTVWLKDNAALKQFLKGKDTTDLKKYILMAESTGSPVKIIYSDRDAPENKMMKEIQEELVKDGILSEKRQKITLMFQYSDLLNGKKVLGDKYEKYKAIFNKHFPKYDSFATTKTFRLK